MNSPEQKKDIDTNALSNTFSNSITIFLHIISFIKSVNLPIYTELISKYKEINKSTLPITLENLAEFSLHNESFRKLITDSYHSLLNSPEKLNILHSYNQQVTETSSSGSFFKPSKENFLNKLEAFFKKNGKPLSSIQRDTMIMHHFLSPSLTISKQEGKIKERYLHELNNIDFKSTQHPDAILIFGNDDLKQAEHIIKIYNALDTLGYAPTKIFITDVGNYHSNPTLLNLLMDAGIPQNKIVTEDKSTNSEQNIHFTDALMQESEPTFQHILISGKPTKILRQIRSYEMQSQYDWQRITTLPPSFDEIQQQYYTNPSDSIFNIIDALREIANFLDHTLNSDFLSERVAPSKENLSESIQLLIDYYTMLTKLELNKTAIVNNFLTFCHSKADGKPDEKLKTLLTDDIRSMTDYFNFVFHLIEVQHFKSIVDQQHLTLQATSAPKARR